IRVGCRAKIISDQLQLAVAAARIDQRINEGGEALHPQSMFSESGHRFRVWTCGMVNRPHPHSRPTRAHARTADAGSEEHTSELQSLMRISYAVFCLKKQ